MKNTNMCPGRAVKKHKNRLSELDEFNLDGEHHKRNDRCQLSCGLHSCKKPARQQKLPCEKRFDKNDLTAYHMMK